MRNSSGIIIYSKEDGTSQIEVKLENETLWLSQKQLCELFDRSKSTISGHIKDILEDEELDRDSVVRNYRTTASDGKNYDVEHYSLDMVIALGFKVRSRSGVQFRKWANSILKEYVIKGFAMDNLKLVFNTFQLFGITEQLFPKYKQFKLNLVKSSNES